MKKPKPACNKKPRKPRLGIIGDYWDKISISDKYSLVTHWNLNNPYEEIKEA